MSDYPPNLPENSNAQIRWERSVIEKMAFSSVKEQRHARRWKMFFSIMWLIYGAVFLWSIMRSIPMPKDAVDRLTPHTAVVKVHGVIADSEDANVQSIVKSVRKAFENEQSQAVVLHINSPGGSPVQSGIINEALWRLKKQHKKPLYAVVGDICASGGYYIAAAADKIYVDKASLVGSIGVRMDGFGFTETMKKLGVERRLITAGKDKGFLDPFSPVDEKQKAHVQNMLNQIHQQFIDVVRKGRGKRLHEQDDIFSGLIWTGQQAVQMGLADSLGNTASVARDVVKHEKIVDYTHSENVTERLIKRLGMAIGQGAVQSTKNNTKIQ